MLTLDADHRYWWDKQSVPGFSEICKDLGGTKDNPFYTDEGRDEGMALHKWLIFLASGQEAKDEPDERIAGRVAGIRKFLGESAFRFEGGETPLYCKPLNFACTPDIWGHLGSRAAVVEAKRGKKLKYHCLQTAAQKIALASNGFIALDRYSLHLRDGDYRLEQHTDKADEDRWKILVMAYHAKTHY